MNDDADFYPTDEDHFREDHVGYSTTNSHPCLKAQVRCYIQRYDEWSDQWITLVVGRNSCISSAGPDKCAREGLPGGEQYELCGPPVHAETDALSQLDIREWRKTDTDNMRAVVTGQDWLCRDCQKALFDAHIRAFVVKG